MLFSYRYVTHSIETFQTWLDHLVKEVWCKADQEFSLNLLHSELREVVEAIYNTEEDTTRGKTGDWLFGPIKRIYQIFRVKLTAAQRAQVSAWYDYNNDIEAICSGDLAKLPITYAEIGTIDAELATELKAFSRSLFTDVISLKAVASRIGVIDAHYNAFVLENKEGKCPYCGFGNIKGVHHTKREAYDHFLPKGTYPFNSVNFRNLAPVCSECNSSYKLQRDPLRSTAGVRRRAFYSYALKEPDVTVSVVLKSKDLTNLQPADVELQLDAPGRDEEVETWNEVFGIKERYKAKCCGENEGKGWFIRVRDEHRNYNLTPEQMLAAEIRSARNKPWADANFLKAPFLIACQSAGILKI